MPRLSLTTVLHGRQYTTPATIAPVTPMMHPASTHSINYLKLRIKRLWTSARRHDGSSLQDSVDACGRQQDGALDGASPASCCCTCVAHRAPSARSRARVGSTCAGSMPTKAALMRRGVPPHVIRMIVDPWLTTECRRWQRRRRAYLEFSVDDERFYGPGY